MSKPVNMGQVSDGYHTFDELYFHRMILFATIVNKFSESAWKSLKHSDEETNPMYKNYFIVGIKTAKGDFSYHYDVKYWDLFKVKELDRSPKFDGHTSKDVTRLLSLV